MPRPETLSPRARKLVAAALVGGAIGAVGAVLAYLRPGIVERGEFWTYDLRARGAADLREASREIVLVNVYEEDIEAVETHYDLSWPWPREMFGYVARYATQAGARAVVFDWVFQDRSAHSAGDDDRFAGALRESGRAVVGYYASTQPPRAVAGGRWGVEVKKFPSRVEALTAAYALSAWRTRVFVNGERLLIGGEESADAVKEAWARMAGADALQGIFPAGEPPAPRLLADEEVLAEVNALKIARERDALPATRARAFPSTPWLKMPQAILAAAAARVGVVTQFPEADGVFRRYAPAVEHDGKLYPSLALAAFMVDHPESGALVLAGRRVPLDEDGFFAIRFHGGNDAYPSVSAYKVIRSFEQLEEKQAPEIAPETFKDKYVIVSASAQALYDARVTPLSRTQLGATIHAAALDNLLAARAIRRTSPLADAGLALGLALSLAVLIVLLWTAIRSPIGALACTTGLTAVAIGGYSLLADYLYRAHDLWLPVTVPAAGAALATFASLLYASSAERRQKRFLQEALNRYTSAELVRELEAHPEHLALGGQKREISVYFSDLAGFTTISEHLEPEDLVALLNDYLTKMSDVVNRHEGYVDKYIGDAIMAFWGGLLPDPRHAQKAVLAAIEMRRVCLDNQAEWILKFGHGVLARAGVNSGPAVVGNMGSKLKYNYTVMGDMVNLASRLEGANKAYGSMFLISEFTYAQIKDVVDTRELDLMTVKGKEKPVVVYEVLDARGHTDAGLLEVSARFAEGLALYRARDFAAAIAAFERALAVHPDDGPSKAYIDRCRHFLAEPPAPDWDGVWHMKEK